MMDPSLGHVQVKQELDDRAEMQTGMDLPDFFQDDSASMGDQFDDFRRKRHKKEKKKKKKHKHKKDERERGAFPGTGFPDLPDGFNQSGDNLSRGVMSSGSSSGSAPGSPSQPGDMMF
jgi:hypothetical protein